MTTIGILDGGTRKKGLPEIEEIAKFLRENSKERVTIRVADWDDHLSARAESLMAVDVLLVKGGSRPALAAMKKRGTAKTPIIVFSTVSQYVVDQITDPTITTGVCASTSDDEGARLDYMLEFLGYNNPAIGVLRNSSRPDASDQWQIIKTAAQNRCSLIDGDLNSLTMKQCFDAFDNGGADGLLVAADPFMYHNGQEVVDRAKKADLPAIYQWSEFVTKNGGLMSHGANRDYCNNRAKQMATDIGNGAAVPNVEYAPFELYVSRALAMHFTRWPLPSVFAGAIIV
jgi:hypothetical protein